MAAQAWARARLSEGDKGGMAALAETVAGRIDVAPQLLPEALEVEDGKRRRLVEHRAQQVGHLLGDRPAVAPGADSQVSATP